RGPCPGPPRQSDDDEAAGRGGALLPRHRLTPPGHARGAMRAPRWPPGGRTGSVAFGADHLAGRGIQAQLEVAAIGVLRLGGPEAVVEFDVVDVRVTGGAEIRALVGLAQLRHRVFRVELTAGRIDAHLDALAPSAARVGL